MSLCNEEDDRAFSLQPHPCLPTILMLFSYNDAIIPIFDKHHNLSGNIAHCTHPKERKCPIVTLTTNKNSSLAKQT